MNKITLLTDIAFAVLIGWSIFAIIVLHTIFNGRIVIAEGIYAPEAYKVIIWSLFALAVLRPRFGPRYFLAFAFIYCLAEDIGNWTYIFVHLQFFVHAYSQSFWNPFPQTDHTLTEKYLVFNIVPLITFAFIRKKLKVKWWAFLPFIGLILVWLSIGYPLITDYSANVIIPPVLFYFEVVWMVFYLVGWGISLWGKQS